jgi:hypothetical protein
MSVPLITHAYTLPFRIRDLDSMNKHIDGYVGVNLQLLDPVQNTIRLVADHGTWEVYEVVDGTLVDDIIDLDTLVVGHMAEGEVAVFTWTRVHDDTIDAGIYAVNNEGRSHADSLYSSASRAVAALGAPEAASVVDYLQNPNGTPAI